jgi:hypothetical protein
MFRKLRNWRRIAMRYDRCHHTPCLPSASQRPPSSGSMSPEPN